MTKTSVRGLRALPVALVGVLAAGTVAVLLPTSALAGGTQGNGHGPGGQHQNVIFINGDGMAAAQREAARLYLQGFDGELTMDSLPVSGLQTTDPRDDDETITDSAAAATAWATGVKTDNGAISVGPEGEPLTPLGRAAKQAGLATGIVTTAQVTDATPAAFFSSVANRSAQDEIARQYLEESQVDVVLGGGEDWWYPAGDEGAYADRPAEDPSEASKGTKGNLVDEAQSQGYQYVTDADQLAAADGGRLLGLFANEEMFQQRPEGQGDLYQPVVPLADMTSKALGVLDRHKEGFFLVVEEEAVDEMAHNNNAARMLQAMEALEDAVTVARQYVAEHPDTLLIVTGDHECGGLTVEGADSGDESGDGESAEDGPLRVADSDKQFVMDWTTTGHTGAPTPVTAEGPKSEELSGYYPSTHIHDVMQELLLG